MTSISDKRVQQLPSSMLGKSTNLADSYLAASRDHDANREILESQDYFQSAEVTISPVAKPTGLVGANSSNLVSISFLVKTLNDLKETQHSTSF